MSIEIAVEQLRVRLNANKGRFHEIAASQGLSYSWLCKFAADKQKNPTVGSLEALRVALDAFERGPEPSISVPAKAA